MHIDLDQTEPQVFQSAVCIIGAGIAGLALATRLAELGIEVHLLEAGGLTQESRSQAFYTTEHAATTHRGVTEGRFRTFGGSSTQWGGQLLPFTQDIFTPSPGIPSHPWPVSEQDLSPYYPHVERIFEVDPLPYTAALLPALGHPPVPFSPDITLRYSKWAPFARRNLAQTLGPAALASRHITVFTHANAATLEHRGTAPTIEAVRVLNYSAREFRFLARIFVVACGTVESSRLLLASPAVPNPHDQLGRGFNDHLSFHAGEFTNAQSTHAATSSARQSLLDRLGPFFVDGTLHTAKLEASAEARAREQLLAVMAHIVIQEPEDSGTAAIRNLLRAVQSGKLKQAIGQNLLPVLRGLGDVARLLLSARFKRRRAVSSRARVILNIDVEQAPNPDNRIRLSEQLDALGLPRAIVDWRVNPAEQDTAIRFARILRRELAALNLSPTTWSPAIEANTPPEMLDTYHAMGGLNMGTDPTTSVVDPNLAHHQLDNLYIASCAVFPSGSSSNPTFTMLALTLRLADHLRNKL